MESTAYRKLTRRKPGRLVRMILGVETVKRAREAVWGYIFLIPWLAGLIIFVGGPIVASLVLAFTEYDINASPRFIGLANFQQAFSGDKLFWPSLGRTFYFTAVYVPIAVVGSLFLAILLNQNLRFTNAFRTLFFLPHLTPAVAMAVLWLWLLHPSMGPVNYGLKRLGLPQPGWFTSRDWAMPAVILVNLWAGIGGNRMLIFLAGLQGVPQELQEAAQIDGAGLWTRFRHVTLPMISPVLLFNLILAVIGALKSFTTAFVATKGGPAYATWFFALHIYNQAFMYYRLGYGSALAWVFAVILIVFTLVQMKLSNRWVYYAGG